MTVLDTGKQLNQLKGGENIQQKDTQGTACQQERSSHKIE